MLIGGDRKMINKCVICNREIPDNKKLGFVLNDYVICSACEYLISIVPVHSCLYDYLKNSIKKVIIKEPA